MPTLEELIDAEGYYELGSIDDTTYCWMDIVVAVSSDGIATPLCMKDDWQKTQQFATIEARREIADLTASLFALRRELIPLQERANRVAWLESEVSRLTHDLESYRLAEAIERGGSVTINPFNGIGAYEVQMQRDCDNAKPPVCSLTGEMKSEGPCQCSWCSKVRQAGQISTTEIARSLGLELTPTNSHIAPEAPIFRKLCQCDACREIRIHSGYPAAEIEGH